MSSNDKTLVSLVDISRYVIVFFRMLIVVDFLHPRKKNEKSSFFCFVFIFMSRPLRCCRRCRGCVKSQIEFSVYNFRFLFIQQIFLFLFLIAECDL